MLFTMREWDAYRERKRFLSGFFKLQTEGWLGIRTALEQQQRTGLRESGGQSEASQGNAQLLHATS